MHNNLENSPEIRVRYAARSTVIAVAALLITDCRDVVQSVDAPRLESTPPTIYSMVDLGTLGGTSSVATWVNDAGQVVGSSQLADGTTHPFLWQNGRMSDLGTLGGDSGQADRVNSIGQVAGWATIATEERHAFVWSDGLMQDLGPVDVAAPLVLLNDNGQVAWTDASTPTHSFLLTNGTRQDLGGGTQVLALSNRGEVVGSANGHGFDWRDGVMTDLGSLGSSSAAVEVNESGQAVGLSYDTARISHALMWDNGVMIDLGTLPGDVHAAAVAINENHQVAVNSYPLSFYPAHAFLWQGGAQIPLSPSYLDDPFEYRLAGINNHGVIAGTQKSVFTDASHAVVWAGGLTIQLSTPDGSSSFASAINGANAVVGRIVTASGVQHAALWRAAPTATASRQQ